MPRCSLSWLSACMLASLRTPPFSLPPSPSLDTYVPAQARLRRNRVNACKTRATQNRHGRRNHGCLTCRATSRRLFSTGSSVRASNRIFPFFSLSFYFLLLLLAKPYLFISSYSFFFQGNRARNETRRDETRRNTFDDESVYRTNHLAPFPASTSLFSPI